MKKTAIDSAMERADSWSKKIDQGESGVKLDDIPKLIDVLGLKIVERSRICITPRQLAEFEACRTLAAEHLSTPKLEQDWDK